MVVDKNSCRIQALSSCVSIAASAKLQGKTQYTRTGRTFQLSHLFGTLGNAAKWTQKEKTTK